MEDWKNVFNHFSFGRKLNFVENQDFARVFDTKPLQQIETKSSEPVLICDHNTFDISWHDPLQYGNLNSLKGLRQSKEKKEIGGGRFFLSMVDILGH